MKKKILSIVLIFTIVLSSSISSFANDNDLVIDYDKSNRSALATLGGYVITKETFNIIIGVAGACGVALLTENDMFDFVQNTINTYARKYEKVDSGDFSTAPTAKEIIDKFETEIKNGSSKDPKNPNKLLINSGLVGLFVSLFDSMKSDEENFNIVGSIIPIKPKYFNAYSELKHSSHNWLNTVNGSRLRLIVSNTSIACHIEHEDKTLGGSSYTLEKPRISYVKCQPKVGFCSTSKCSQLGDSNIYHLEISSDSTTSYSYLYNVKTSKHYDFYIPSTNLMSSYSPIRKDVFVNNSDIPSSTNPNLNINGSMDLPESSVSDNLPTYPSLGDIDFSGFDFSSLGSLFDNFKNKFPFSIPFDLHNILSSFSLDAEAPIFDFQLFSETITIDLTQFNELANIVRMFVLIGWVVGLFILTKTFGG